MAFTAIEKKGISLFLISDSLPADRLSVHRSSVPAGSRSHAAHTHDGVEAFVVLRGTATVEVGGEVRTVGESEVIVVDATMPHGIRNDSSGELEYLVVISR